MELMYSAAESNYPLEYSGRRELQYYKDWHHFGIIDPVENDDASVHEDDPMEEEVDDDFVHIEPDKHPKGSPGCN